jgi:hypothetical protein
MDAQRSVAAVKTPTKLRLERAASVHRHRRASTSQHLFLPNCAGSNFGLLACVLLKRSLRGKRAKLFPIACCMCPDLLLCLPLFLAAPLRWSVRRRGAAVVSGADRKRSRAGWSQTTQRNRGGRGRGASDVGHAACIPSARSAALHVQQWRRGGEGSGATVCAALDCSCRGGSEEGRSGRLTSEL